jgi:L-asparaginase
MASFPHQVVILATGGTIAGAAAQSTDNVSYKAAQVAVESLVAAVPALAGAPIEAQQVAQLNSKDLPLSLWADLAARITAAHARDDVAGVVITHGTDTLEETTYALHRLLPAAKPVVLTAAMRPATSLQADGPQNLLDAVTVARSPGARGVVGVLNGRVLAGHEMRKVHNYRVDAFSSGDAGPVAMLEEGRLRQLREWPVCEAPAAVAPQRLAEPWPWVEIVSSGAGADGRIVDLLVSAGVRGLVASATGNGSVHDELLAALLRAREQGIPVLRATRCALGSLVDDGGPLEGAAGLTPAQARVELMLRLMA